jgi:hypothetical protein
MRRTSWAILLMAGLAAGCGGGKGEPAKVAPKTPSAAEATDPAMVELVKRTTAATTIGSESAPVELRFEFAGVPVAGRPVGIELSVLPQAAVPTLRVELRSENELLVVEPSVPTVFDKVQAGTIQTIHVQAVPERTGTTTLRAVVTLDQPTGQERRTFELPVVVPAPGAGGTSGSGPSATGQSAGGKPSTG